MLVLKILIDFSIVKLNIPDFFNILKKFQKICKDAHLNISSMKSNVHTFAMIIFFNYFIL